MKKPTKRLAIFSILFLQLCWIPNTNANFTNAVLKVNDDAKPLFVQKTAIAILVDFLDTNFTTEKGLIEQRASNMTSYFSEVSYNMFLLKVNFTDKTYTLPHNMSFYAVSSKSHSQLAQNCISQADPEINYNSYDYVLVVHAGPSRLRTQNPNHILTCAISGLQIQTADGQIINSCAILSEYDSICSFCHETAHLLGLHDLYPEEGYTQGDVGCWDLMGTRTVSQEFDSPPQLSAWSRMRLGWMNSSLIKTININDTRDTTMLYDLESPPLRGEVKAIKVAIATDIYYLVELRNQILSDRDLPSSGILIYRCDESASDEKSHSITLMDTSLSDFQTSEERKTYSDAAFDNDRPLFCDPENGIAIELSVFTSYASLVSNYRQQKLHTLKLALPQSGVEVSVDSRTYVSDENGEVIAIVLGGNHTVKVALPPTVTSLRWSDGVASNPREIQLLTDTTLACFYSLNYAELQQQLNYLSIILVLTIIVAFLTISVILLSSRSFLPRHRSENSAIEDR